MAETDFKVTVDYTEGIMRLCIDEGDKGGEPVRIDGCELFCRADPAGFSVKVGREIVKPLSETAEDARKMASHADLGGPRTYL